MNIEINKKKSLPIALTMGDPAGIGPEITALGWKHFSTSKNYFFVIGDPAIYAPLLAKNGFPKLQKINHPNQCSKVFHEGLPVLPVSLANTAIPGKANHANAPQIVKSIQMAVDFCKSNTASSLVTNPIAKSVLYKAGFAHPGHTEFLGALAKGFTDWPAITTPVMMLCGGGLRVALVSVHCPLSEVPAQITKQSVERCLRVLHKSLIQDFAIKDPRIAMCGLNPHAGEDGAMGKEESQILNPVAIMLRQEGIDVDNAKSADTLFTEQARNNYDGVLAMYHDQGLIPVKTLDFHGGTNVTLGLPFVRVSPDHGTGFDIAGKNLARADSLIAALTMANQISHNRNLL